MMRPTRNELGKNIATEVTEKPRPKFQAPELNEEDLIKANALTLIGRVTNPQVQRIRSVLPGLSQNWKLKGRVIGTDIGKNRFKYTFDFEEDVALVLANQPYQFARYMIILQRWTSSVSARLDGIYFSRKASDPLGKALDWNAD